MASRLLWWIPPVFHGIYNRSIYISTTIYRVIPFYRVKPHHKSIVCVQYEVVEVCLMPPPRSTAYGTEWMLWRIVTDRQHHLYLQWFFVNIVIVNLLLPYRLGWLALPNIPERCVSTTSPAMTRKRTAPIMHCHDLRCTCDVRNQFEPFLTKLVFLYFDFGPLATPLRVYSPDMAWSNSVRCDAPLTMMAFRMHIGTCSIYLSA